MLKSVSNVCCVMKWYPPREMTSPNDTQMAKLLLFNCTENGDTLTLEMELAH